MKRILLSGVAATVLIGGQAMAADLRVKAPVLKAPPMATAYNWSGCYIGAHIGGGWSTKDWSYQGDTQFAAGPVGTQDLDGIIGGGQIGCNIQTGAWVFGIEGDASWSGIEGDFSDAEQGTTSDYHTEVQWLGTVTGRIGYATDRFLLYVKGGVAFAHDEYTEVYTDAQQAVTPYTGDQTRWGWTVGAGVEFALTGNWTAKLEYNYMDFGSKAIDLVAASGDVGTYDIDQQIHIVKFGLNYRFGSDAIVARY